MNENRDLSKDVLESLVNSLKTKNLEDRFHIECKEDDKENYYSCSISVKRFTISVKIHFKTVRVWFYKKELKTKLRIFFDSKGYGDSNKTYEFDYDSNYDKLKLEVYNILKKRYSDDIFKAECKRDLEIIKAMDESIDDRFKRENKIDNLLE